MRKTKRITISDIAGLAGVSKATASLVLNGRGEELRVAKETRERVLALARQHHYQPSIHARMLHDARSHTLGLVMPAITNHGFAAFSHALENLCRAAGLQLLVACTDENAGQERAVVNNLVARQVDGLIVASSMLNDSDYVSLSEQLPVLLFDRNMSNTTLPWVITDSVTPTTELVEKLARACPEEIYFMGGQGELSPTQDRLAGFQAGLARAGVTLQPEWIIQGNYHPGSGYEMFAALCHRLGRPPKAMFTAACGLLEGVLRYMSEHDLLSSDIRIASFDDHYLYDSLSIPIDTIEQNVPALAQACFSMLTTMISGEDPAHSQLILPATLRLRG